MCLCWKMAVRLWGLNVENNGGWQKKSLELAQWQ